MRHSKVIFMLLVSMIVIYGCSSSKADQHTGSLEKISEYDHLPDTFSNEDTEFSVHSDKEKYVLPVTNMALIITNFGSNAVGFGEYRTLEKFQENTWYEIPYREQFAFGDIGLGLVSGDVTEQEMPLEYLKHELTPGKYRIVKTFRIDEKTEEIVLAAQFEIEE